MLPALCATFRTLKESCMPGMGELLVILAIVLVVFGANKLPGIGDALGRSIKNFKRASAGEGEIEVSKGGKQVTEGKSGKQIEDAKVEGAAGADEDEGWGEGVVRRKKAKKG